MHDKAATEPDPNGAPSADQQAAVAPGTSEVPHSQDISEIPAPTGGGSVEPGSAGDDPADLDPAGLDPADMDPADIETALERLAALDPADAPDPASRIAATLAERLSDHGDEPAPA